MPGFFHRTGGHGRAGVAASVALALFAGGCAGGSSDPPAATDTGRNYSASFVDIFTGSSAKSPQTVTGAASDVFCPTIEVRQGASTLTIGPPGSAMSVRYQGEFVREARECSSVGGNMVMRIGVQGRVIVGPAGGPGQVDVPLRFAVVQDTPGGMRPIVTKLVHIPVTLAPGAGNAMFTYIEDGLSFPLPAPTSLLDEYTAYVGFDPLAAEPQEKRPKPAAKPKPRPKPRPNPAAGAN